MKGTGSPSAPAGTGPGGRITPEDIQSGFQELAGEVQETKEAATPVLAVVGVVTVVAIVGIAFLLGRRRGRRRSTVVEIRRV